MSLELDNLQDNTANARVDYQERGDINIVFRPANVTEDSIRRLQRVQELEAHQRAGGQLDLSDSLELIAAINTLLLQVCISWDLTRHGVPVPLTEEGLGTVQLHVRKDVLTAIFSESTMDPMTGTPSQPTLPATSGQAQNTSSSKQGNRASRRNSRSSK